MADPVERVDSQADESAITHLSTEAASDSSPRDNAAVLSKETATTEDGASTAAQGTHSEVAAAAEDDVESLSSTADDDPDEDPEELSIEDLLRQAGWESRGPPSATSKTSLGKGTQPKTGPPSSGKASEPKKKKGSTTSTTPKTSPPKN